MIVLRYIFSVIYISYFVLIMCVFHVLQVIAFAIGGQKAQRKMANYFSAGIEKGLILTFSSTRFINEQNVPTDKPLIVIANHQSLLDIPSLQWGLRKYNPVFIAKKELEKNIPSISYNLRKSGAALIDRSDKRASIVEIANLGKRMQAEKLAVIIFPEGTRTKTQHVNKFAEAGILTLLKKAPDALIVPVAIRNTGVLTPNGSFLLNLGVQMSWEVLPIINPKDFAETELVNHVEQVIRAKVELG